MLPRKYRLPAKEFQKNYRDGFKVRGKYGMLIFSKSTVPSPRFGYVVSKKVGNAVLRHRFTRLLRDISIQAVKDYGMENMGINIQYISFEFCDDREMLKEEFFKQIEKAIK